MFGWEFGTLCAKNEWSVAFVGSKQIKGWKECLFYLDNLEECIFWALAPFLFRSVRSFLLRTPSLSSNPTSKAKFGGGWGGGYCLWDNTFLVIWRGLNHVGHLSVLHWPAFGFWCDVMWRVCIRCLRLTWAWSTQYRNGKVSEMITQPRAQWTLLIT